MLHASASSFRGAPGRWLPQPHCCFGEGGGPRAPQARGARTLLISIHCGWRKHLDSKGGPTKPCVPSVGTGPLVAPLREEDAVAVDGRVVWFELQRSDECYTASRDRRELDNTTILINLKENEYQGFADWDEITQNNVVRNLHATK